MLKTCCLVSSTSPRCPPQVVLAVLARRAEWQLDDPNEGFNEFPMAVPKKGLPLTISPLMQ